MGSSHHKEATDAEIQSFWDWFQTIATDLGRDLENDAILEEIDRRVSALGDVSWELGPGLQEENAFVVTPDGSKQHLATTRRIVAHAPRIPRWEFHWARPPRTPNLEFTIDGDRGGEIHVDARSWRYVLFRYPDQTFDVVMEENNLGDISESDRYAAAVVLLDGILGEGKRLELIGGIEAVAVLSEDQEAKANPIEVLSKHLGSLIRKK